MPFGIWKHKSVESKIKSHGNQSAELIGMGISILVDAYALKHFLQHTGSLKFYITNMGSVD